ncbi:cytochrome P450 1B1-like [Gouania willdenowi]|nr:cytochrome P450 1B1-like [Gouania willdenowi]
MDVVLKGIDPSTSRAVLVGCAAILLSLHLYRWLRQRRGSGPPGPFPWPLIGNAAQLGKAPHLYFSRMAKKYGNVFQIKLGNRTVVVLNGDSIKQALVKQGPDFAGRPDFASFQYVSSGNSLAFGTSTDFWKEQRRVAHSSVRMFSTGNPLTKKTFECHVLTEVREVLKLFVAKTETHRFFQPMNYMVVSIANTMSAVCFGKRYSYEDEEFRQVIGRNDQFTQTVGAGSIVDVMPWLQYFPNPIKNMFNNFIKLNLEFTTFIHDKVLEHRKSIQSSTIRDVTDALILALEKFTDKTQSSMKKESDYVTAAIGDIFGASQDTLSTAMQWIVLVLVNYPELQLRLQQEVDRVVDRSRMPSIEDQSQVPYVMAFIYEVMRYTSFVPLTIPHSTTNDTSIMGYTIPKNTVVFINQWSVNHDPGIWSNPETFDPERFLDQNGELNKDLTGNVLIFSLGKRRCIGEELSKLHLFLFTSMLVHLCYISPDPSRPPDMGYTYGLTMKPNGYYIAVTPRDDIGFDIARCCYK